MILYTNRPDMPPHNFIIAAWANSGFPAALAAAGFIVVTILFCLRVASSQQTRRDRRTAVIALCVVGWVFLHGMADNTYVYGEQRTMFLFALAIGFLYAMVSEPNNVIHTRTPRARTVSRRQSRDVNKQSPEGAKGNSGLTVAEAMTCRPGVPHSG